MAKEKTKGYLFKDKTGTVVISDKALKILARWKPTNLKDGNGNQIFINRYMATLINSKKEYEAFYYYKGSKPKRYPKEYPCVCRMVDEDAGIAGSVMVHYVAYFPMNATPREAFIAGLSYEWENI